MHSPRPGIMQTGATEVSFNKAGTNLQTVACSSEEEEGNEAWDSYAEKKNVVLEFLHSNLSLHLLKRHHRRIELLRRCSFHIEILPKNLALGDQNHWMEPTAMFQLINPSRFQRMKEVGSSQTKIQLLLLSELLGRLERGREDLVYFLESYDMMTFLSQWHVIWQRLSDLSGQMDNFLALLVPGRLYVKHRLVSDVGVAKIPDVKLVLVTKMPVLFDRKESVAHKGWVSLKWFTGTPQPQLEQYEIHFSLLDFHGPQEKGHSGIVVVASNSCEMHNLRSDCLYRFTVQRATTYTLVYEQWRDSLTLKTKTVP